MSSKIRRLFVWSVVILLAVLLVCGLYARKAWEEWKAAQAIQQFDWQGVRLSLDGIHAEAFSLVRSDGAQRFSVEGDGFALGWSLWHLALSNVRVERLDVEIPSWPVAQATTETGSPLNLPDQLPSWLPDRIAIRHFSASLPDKVQVRGNLVLSLAANPEQWHLETDETWIEAALPDIHQAGWTFRGVNARVGLAGSAGFDQLTLDVLPDSVLHVDRLDGPRAGENIWLGQVDAAADGLRLEATYSLTDRNLLTLAYEGPLTLAARSLHHPNLQPQFWNFKGLVDGNLRQVDLRGAVAGEAGVTSDVSVLWPVAGVPVISATLDMAGEKAGKAFAETLTPWPSGLEISEGQLNLQAEVRLPGATPVAEAKVRAKGVSGILDRMAWTGLNGQLDVQYGDKMVVRTSDLRLERLNPGIAMGPLVVSGRYEASREAPFAGTVSVIKGHAGFLGGELRVKPGEWRVTDLPARVTVWLNDVQVGRLMKVYPAEGLDGSGTLEGEVPLLISMDGVRVAGGVINAASPGGMLKFPAGRLQALAQNNDTMKLVVLALQNFNYDRLRSTIDYDQDGTLSLGLRLEGSNPDVRDGHPMVVNINFEEDIPALLTSLQLSGRVNEAVTEKVRNLMKKREAGKTGQ
ncbi:YdbH domain-containing protein [Marinobacter sediminum]|uniref:intermembrane phospholipid transport protein YdbH family protein n=1 Tax=Marinobacter sediminum TaxID=256323 RepID=UPI00202E4434|nr:YdbH domain-containing protein [Marinobacter sediminum]MCM0611291.1 YdbH domain-containing protein [Marinobacter sediminum]